MRDLWTLVQTRFITNGYLWMQHSRGRCNVIQMFSQGLLNKSSLF